MRFVCLSRRFVSSVSSVAPVVIHGQSTETRGKEREGVVVTVTETAVGEAGAGRGGSLTGRSESSFRRTAVKRGGMHTTVGGILSTHGGIGAGGAQSRRKGIRARWTTELLSGESSARIEATRGKRSRTWSSTHRRRTHVEARRSIHGGGEGRICNHCCTSTTGTTTETLHVLGEVVVATTVRSTLPVSSSEGNDAGGASSAHMAHSVAMSHVVGRGHHGWMTVVGITHGVIGRASSHGRERAPETGCAALEV